MAEIYLRILKLGEVNLAENFGKLSIYHSIESVGGWWYRSFSNVFLYVYKIKSIQSKEWRHFLLLRLSGSTCSLMFELSL